MCNTLLPLSLLAFVSLSSGLSCPPLPRRAPPTSVRDLRIDDFAAIMAMGDSMTAGFNAVKANLHEYRGVGFSIGGDPGATTLPNLIADVSGTAMAGAALGVLNKPSALPKPPCVGGEVDQVCRLSAAVDGSSVQDLIDTQVGYLRDTLENAPFAANVSLTTDWKLLTILTGLDDVVFYNATDPSKRPTSDNVLEHNFDALLTAIHQQLPKTYVNIMALPEKFEPKMTTSTLECKLFKRFSEAGHVRWTDTSTWIEAIKGYNKIISKIPARWNAKNFPDFAVSVQPFMQHANLTIADFDTLDCFHPNLVTHQRMAVGIWNNMLAGSQDLKKTSWTKGEQPSCPTADSRLVVE